MAGTEHLDWGAKALWSELVQQLPGLSIDVLARCDSTNSTLLDRVRSQQMSSRDYGRRDGDLRPSILVAEHQTQGRGRMGRAWHSTPGASLTFSLGLALDDSQLAGLSLAVGCAIAEALEPATEAAPRITLKWPNDLWLDGAKLGGILIETLAAGAQRLVVIGIGLNVNDGAQPAEASLSTGFASLQRLYPGITAPETLARVARGLVHMLANYQGLAAWSAVYARRDALAGHTVVAGALEGVARGITEEGGLRLQTAQGEQVLNSGEVSVRLSAQVSSQPGSL
ncbi:MAG TPA: biotin--[acetyl-CoA-carboxylase] ligase [Burkholderiaceae bacterium]